MFLFRKFTKLKLLFNSSSEEKMIYINKSRDMRK